MILQVKSFHAGFSVLTTDVLRVGQKNRTVDATPHLTRSKTRSTRALGLSPDQGKNNVYYIYFAVRILQKPKRRGC